MLILWGLLSFAGESGGSTTDIHLLENAIPLCTALLVKNIRMLISQKLWWQNDRIFYSVSVF